MYRRGVGEVGGGCHNTNGLLIEPVCEMCMAVVVAVCACVNPAASMSQALVLLHWPAHCAGPLRDTWPRMHAGTE